MVGPRLSGEKVNLRPLAVEDLPRRAEWLNDSETFKLFTGSLPTKTYGLTEAEIWRLGLESDPAAIVWAIETKQGRHIGDIDLHSIDHFNRSAKLTVLLGDKAFWNHGYGTSTIRTVLSYAFTETQLRKVDLRVYEFNARGIGCYRKCGFLPTWATSGTQTDPPGLPEVHMSVTKEHFLAQHPDNTTVSS